LKRYDDAIRSFRKAIQIEPSYATAWKNLGLALRSQRREAEADEAFQKAHDLGLD
jgi:Flp pilus assembly protein TadD